MTTLEQITPGSRIHGLLPGRAVTVVQIEWHGSSAVTVTHRDDQGNLGNQLLFRDDESRLEVEEAGSAWAFDADGRAFKLVSEALSHPPRPTLRSRPYEGRQVFQQQVVDGMRSSCRVPCILVLVGFVLGGTGF